MYLCHTHTMTKLKNKSLEEHFTFIVFFWSLRKNSGLSFHPSLSIIEKQIEALLLLRGRHKNIYLLGPNCCEVQHTTHLLQLPQECGHTQCKQAITGRVFSGNLPMLFVSVQRLQRVWSRSERAQNGNKPGRASFRLRVGGWIYLKRSCRRRMC